MNLFRILKFSTNGNFWVSLLIFTFGCASTRPRVPPGEIPRSKSPTVSEEEYGHNVLNSLVQQYPLDENDEHINKTRDIVDKLTKAIGADKEPWHVYVLKADNIVNAGATRGNHIFVWSGIFKAVKYDYELATILSHEIAHILAGHPTPTAEEAANQAIADIAGTAAKEIVSAQGDIAPMAGLAQVLVQQALQAFIVNPEQQRQELEADIIGLNLMAEAGYDPRDTLKFWERVKGSPYFSGGPLPFLSSHPSSKERLKKIRQYLPYALARYERKTSPAFSSRNDSFDLSVPAPESPSSVWTVQDASASVHKEPDFSSPEVTILHKGNRVHIVSRIRRWYRIDSPVSGYIKGVAVSP